MQFLLPHTVIFTLQFWHNYWVKIVDFFIKAYFQSESQLASACLYLKKKRNKFLPYIRRVVLILQPHCSTFNQSKLFDRSTKKQDFFMKWNWEQKGITCVVLCSKWETKLRLAFAGAVANTIETPTSPRRWHYST